MIADIENKAKEILNARTYYRDEAIKNGRNIPCLADFYRVNLIDIYPKLTKAHKELDKVVDKAYQYAFDYKGQFKDEMERVAFLFGLYEQLNH